MPIEIVRPRIRKLKSSGTQYVVTVPSILVKELWWNKEDFIIAGVLELEIEGKRWKALVYHRAD